MLICPGFEIIYNGFIKQNRHANFPFGNRPTANTQDSTRHLFLSHFRNIRHINVLVLHRLNTSPISP